MKLNLFLLLCLTGVIPLVLSVIRKYYLFQQKRTWSDAQAYCKAHHTDLAIIQNNDDMVKIQNDIKTQRFTSIAWIGLYRELNDWHWSLGNEPVGTVTLWTSGQPSYPGAPELCGGIYYSGWGDAPCTAKWPIVCFDDTKAGDERYIYVPNITTWYGAQAYCRKHYTDLASAKGETEKSVIKSLISTWTWIGLIRESWKWTNQTIFSTVNWISGQPNIIAGNNTCAYLYRGQVGDTMCTDSRSFFCYSEITWRKQIMRMEVRSDKDMNDPAVTDAIMKNIKQKLEERGLALNVTLKWRVQPDGKVFHKKKEKRT